jgi:lauroyl/myristoyl acyltransferase
MNDRSTAAVVRTKPPTYEGWITASDLFTTVKLLCCAIGALAPEAYWPAISAALARLHLSLRRSRSSRIARVCEQHLKKDSRVVEREILAEEYAENIEAIREILPGRWECSLTLHGAESLDQALRRGRGAVLWVSAFAHSDLATKKTLSTAGYAQHHLSATGHPYSPSWFGANVLNPIRLRAENRYLTKRVIVAYGQAQPALDVLRQALQTNGIVTVKAIGAGRKSVTAALLGGSIRLATGALRLACENRAALIPVFTVRDQSGGYAVHCGPDLTLGAETLDGDAMQHMAARYAVLLETFIRTHPGAWQGWFSRSWRPDPPTAQEEEGTDS